MAQPQLQQQQQQAPFMKAICKQVLSGDTVILRGRPVSGPPPERQLSLAYVSAPRLGRKDEKGEPYAWESREQLRKLIVGKEVSFRVLYANKAGREFGQISIGTQDVTQTLLGLGLLRLREERNSKDDLETLVQAEQLAKAAEVGMCSAAAVDIPEIKQTLDDDPRTFLDAHKGKQIDAIVERVRDGSTLQVLLLPSFQTVTLLLSGIKCPTYRKDVPDQPDHIEPFGAEARFFTESRLLQQDVRVILEGLNNKNFVGTVLHQNGNIAEALTKEGFAKVVDWSVTMVTGGSKNLREAEKAAKQKQLRLWKDYKPKADGANGEKTQFVGKVVKIHNGEALVVLHNGVEHKLFLSSIRQPRQKEATEAPYQPEAKEFLRARLIGRKVHVDIDYTKPAEDGYEERVCASIRLDDVNMNEALVSKGLATVVRHRQDDENRASNYDQLLVAEGRAQSAKKGIFSGKDVPAPRINDASESLAKAKQFLGSFKRQGRMPAIVEYVFNGSRFKLHLPRENTKMMFVLAGVRVGRVGKTAEESEPFAQEAFTAVNDRTFQHDVEIEVENVDKNGAFIGTLFLHDDNVAVQLLEQGLATLHKPSADQSIHVNKLYAAEKNAKAGKKNIWQAYDEEAERAAQEAAKAAAAAERKETALEKAVIVPTEILSGDRFYAQTVSEGTKLEKMMSEFATYHKNAADLSSSFVPKKNDLISAQFSADKQWYRARVLQINADKSADVLFVDFGNSEKVSTLYLRPLPIQFASLPPQANEYQLACVQPPVAGSDYAKEAAAALGDLILGRELYCNVLLHADKIAHVLAYEEANVDLGDFENVPKSVNACIIEMGLATVEKRRERYLTVMIDKLTESQTDAKTKRLNMWEYGDFTADDTREFGFTRRA